VTNLPIAAILLAGGSGMRANAGTDLATPKQYRQIGGAMVLRRGLMAFANHPDIAFIQPVIRLEDRAAFDEASAGLPYLPPCIGGATRQDSVRAGLEALRDYKPGGVLIHDAARPFASHALISRAIAAARKGEAALPVLPIHDTVKSVHADGTIGGTLSRDTLRIAQTPQAFPFQTILDAHRKADEAGLHDFTDDAALAEWAGLTVTMFDGDAANMKLTTPDDFAQLDASLANRLSDIRTGNGFDVHAFGDGDHVMLCGVRIPHTRGLSGHSDADVGLHALVDAILGALGDGDIGAHFPPSDPQWKGAASDAFLRDAARRVAARGGMIGHLDVTLICEAPKIGPHREAMRARVADIAGVAPGRVGVKATTSERLGFTGRGEGIAAMATATIRLPWDDQDTNIASP
jgi:2-C-methyl-D-erythritol 4-phosphate cytidylyltransferase/2-C-methyl-D-erythritol 2,4-cyclodiphosphate synthase